MAFELCKIHCCICGKYCHKQEFELDDYKHVVCNTSHLIKGRCVHCNESVFNLKILDKKHRWKDFLLRCEDKKETCQAHRRLAVVQGIECCHFLCSMCLSGMVSGIENGKISRCSVKDCHIEFKPAVIKSFLNRIDGVLKKERSLITLEECGKDLCLLCGQHYSRFYLECKHSFCTKCVHRMLQREHFYELPFGKEWRKVLFCPELKCSTWYLLDNAKLLMLHNSSLNTETSTQLFRSISVPDKDEMNSSMTKQDNEKLCQNPSSRLKMNSSMTKQDNEKLCQNPSCRLKASILLSCTHWICKTCGNNLSRLRRDNRSILYVKCQVAECGIYTELEYFQQDPSSDRNQGELRNQWESRTGDDEPQTMETKGLENIGMICYGSTILQILAQTPGLLPQLRQYKERNTLVLSLLYEILMDINRKDDTTKSSKTVSSDKIELLMDIVSKRDTSFPLYVQNDSHSFLMTLFNLIDNELQESETEWQETPESGPLALFEGKFHSTFTYSECCHKETSSQMFRSIYIPIISKDMISIEEEILWLMNQETFEHNQIPCRKCNESGHWDNVTTKEMKFGKFPDVLILQLGRAQETRIRRPEEYVTLTKITDRIQYPMELSIPARVVDPEIKRDFVYNLYGVVMHTGTIRGGHYDVCVRNNYTRRWLYCDDSFVTTHDEQEIANIPNAYLLFYAK